MEAERQAGRKGGWYGASACRPRSHSPLPAMKKTRDAAEQLRLATAPTQRPNAAGEVRWSSSRAFSRLPEGTLMPAAPLCSALATPDRSNWPSAAALRRRTVCEVCNSSLP